MKHLIVLFLLLLPVSVLAHESEQVTERLSSGLSPIDAVIIVTIIIVIALILSFFFRHKHRHAKKALFLLISIPVIAASVYLAADTVHLNLISETGGPVHWHADFEIWACGEKLEAAPPESIWDNKVGTPVFHHHDDYRMHVEGVLVKSSDADLHNFFEVIGGELTDSLLSVKMRDGSSVSYSNGDECPDGTGQLKFYVNGKLNNKKSEYVLSPEENVPPGDCIIIDFSPGQNETTEKMCETIKAKGGYGVYARE